MLEAIVHTEVIKPTGITEPTAHYQYSNQEITDCNWFNLTSTRST